VALGIGIENDNTTQLGTISPCVAASVTALDNGTCTASDAPSPAKQAGLQAGDVVTAFDGQPVSNWTQLGNAIRDAQAGSPATITARRDGRPVTLRTTLASVPGRSGAYLGIAPTVVFQTASPWGALSYTGSAFGQVIGGSAQAVAALPSALPKLFGKQRDTTPGGQVTSVIGAAEATGQAVAADVGWQYKVSFILLLIASLNIFVGVFNMLPLLPLDGGHIAIVIWERIRAWLARLRGRPDPGLVDISKVLPVCFSIFMVVMFFGVILILADILNPVNLTGG
jgi:membrane-associated protease RseP (regulator of RpoE activity)